MTIQQEAVSLINTLPDDSVSFIIEMMHRMLAPIQANVIVSEQVAKRDVSKRIGIGRGLLGDTDKFDEMNDEIANLFEESCV